MYAPEAIVYHHIPPVRFTKRWWHSRLAEEGRCHAITHQHEHHLGSARLCLKSLFFLAWVGGAAFTWLTYCWPKVMKYTRNDLKISFAKWLNMILKCSKGV